MGKKVLLWFRHDLRLDDHPPLAKALKEGALPIPVYIWSLREEGRWFPGRASCWWLHHSLQKLDASLRAKGSRLLLRSGDTLECLKGLLRETEASALYWGREYDPHSLALEREIKAQLRHEGTVLESFNTKLLFEPWEIASQGHRPYRLFTPFFKQCQQQHLRSPTKAPEKLPPLPLSYKSVSLSSFLLDPPSLLTHPTPWEPGEEGAVKALSQFLKEGLPHYASEKDRVDLSYVSRLSPHLHFGEISLHRIWQALRKKRAYVGRKILPSIHAFCRQLFWREFAYHLLFHFPEACDESLKPKFREFGWQHSPRLLQRWQEGKTGYPLIDASMRQLTQWGWIHNRLRMVVASFLVKDLLIPWQEGARWFWQTLCDADLANNTLNWQWVAGCGHDASPFFRILNPITQAKRYDPEGNYVRHWLPVLKHLPSRWIHTPWEAPSKVLKEAGVELGSNYPYPIVDHEEARSRALEVFEEA